MNRQEIVDVSERGCHAANARLVAFAAEQRVEPDQAMRARVQLCDLVRERGRIAGLQPSLAISTTVSPVINRRA